MTVISDQVPPGQDFLLRRLRDLERQVRELQAGRRLEAATIRAGSLRVVDDNGDLRVQVGLLADGTYGLAAVNPAGQLVTLSTLAFGLAGAAVATVEMTQSDTFTDLTTPGPVVPGVAIGDTGRCLVLISAMIQEFSSDIVRGGRMSVQITGPTPRDAAEIQGLRLGHTDDGAISGGFSSNNLLGRMTAVELIEGLSAGTYAFTAKYQVNGSGSNDPIWFSQRSLAVIPF